MDNDQIITIDKMTARYGDALVLDELSFSVNRGEIFVILGGSGCGKSTLLKHMIGLYKPCSGNIRIGEASVVSAEGVEREALW
jgi:phospholipid/cholesterol/gamma-HCH transport system ATP-binding protein